MTTPTTQHSPRKRARDLLVFDRSDRWGLVGLLALVVLVTMVLEVVLPVVRWARGEAIPIELMSPVTVPQLDATGVGHGPGTYAVLLDDPTTGQRVLDLVPGVVTVALVAIGCVLVLGLLATVAAGDPFHPVNVTRLRGLAGVLLVGSPVLMFLELPAHGALLGSLDLGDIDPAVRVAFPWLPFVAGMVVALIAEAFKTGSRLRDDVEGLV